MMFSWLTCQAYLPTLSITILFNYLLKLSRSVRIPNVYNLLLSKVTLHLLENKFVFPDIRVPLLRFFIVGIVGMEKRRRKGNN